MIDLTIPTFLLRGHPDNDWFVNPSPEGLARIEAAMANKPQSIEERQTERWLQRKKQDHKKTAAQLERLNKYRAALRDSTVQPEMFPLTGKTAKAAIEGKAPVGRRAALNLMPFGSDTTIKVIKPAQQRPGDELGREHYQEMVTYLNEHPDATLADVLLHTAYRRGDYSWDLKKGMIKADIKG